MLNAAYRRSEKQGVPFSIDVDWVLLRLHGGVCESTGMPFTYETDGRMGPRNAYAPSIDRLVPARGYTKKNCRVVLVAVNVACGSWGEKVAKKIMRQWLDGKDAK